LQLANEHFMHLGVDDTDSTRGGCTTYIAALLVEKLENLNVTFVDYPNLIRLNPNVPWKTRGNGALCLRIKHVLGLEEKIKETTIDIVERFSDLGFDGTDPGIVFLQKEKIPQDIQAFSQRTITGITSLKEATKLIKKFGAEAMGFKNCRGVIGSLAAIGETLAKDHTYELIAYRVQEKYGLKRKVDRQSIFEMDECTKPNTFNNVDFEKNRVIITPRGPDPILFGIRGETPRIVKQAFGLVKTSEPIERWLVFRTNQGTDAHLKQVETLVQVEPYSSVIARGFVSQNPRIVPLRHVVFSIEDKSGGVDCVAYEPTGRLRKVARQLRRKDNVEVYGAIRNRAPNRPLTINLEKINILSLERIFKNQNPVCQECDKRLKSMGRNKGFRCEKCGIRYPKAQKVLTSVSRDLKIALYITSPRSQRHLTKPFRRYGLEKTCVKKIDIIVDWHS